MEKLDPRAEAYCREFPFLLRYLTAQVIAQFKEITVRVERADSNLLRLTSSDDDGGFRAVATYIDLLDNKGELLTHVAPSGPFYPPMSQRSWWWPWTMSLQERDGETVEMALGRLPDQSAVKFVLVMQTHRYSKTICFISIRKAPRGSTFLELYEAAVVLQRLEIKKELKKLEE